MKLVSKDRYQKRKKTLLNKAQELKTLCDVDVGLIIYRGDDNADDGNNSTKSAEIWPVDDPELIHQLINSYHHTTADKKAKRGPTKRKYPPPGIYSSAANNKKQRKTEPPKYDVWDDRYDVLPIEKLKEIKGFLEDKISNLKGRYEEMLKSEITKARLEEIKRFLDVEEEDSESLSDQCSPVSAGDAKMMMMPTLSPQNTSHQFEEYSGLIGIEQQRMIKDVDQFGLPIVSIGDSGMVFPTRYNSNLYPYNYNYSSILCGGNGGEGDYLSQGSLIGGGSPMTMITEKRGLSVNVDVIDDLLLGHVVYYSGPPSPLCY